MALATELKVAGIEPVSMIDWEGKIAAVIFLAGCNFRCPYCHNPELITADCESFVPWEDIMARLDKKKGWLDGVVITGGEPTMFKGLVFLIQELKQADLKVKLDTNATDPDVVKQLLDEKMIDYVAIDIKAPFDKYNLVTKSIGQSQNVKKTTEAVIRAGVSHEFRTTVVPGLCEPQDILQIAKYLGAIGAERYYIQQFNPRNVLSQKLNTLRPFPSKILTELEQACNAYLPTKTRGLK